MNATVPKMISPDRRYFMSSDTSACPYIAASFIIEEPAEPVFFDPTFNPNIFFMKNSRKNVSKPDATGEMIHPRPISPRTLKLIFLAPLYNPIPIMHPTITWELETGTIGIGGRPKLTRKDRESG